MTQTAQALLIALYAMLTVAAGGVVHQLTGGNDLVLTVGVVVACGLVAGQFHSLLLRRIERGLLNRELSTLKQANLLMIQELEQTRNRVRDLSNSMGQKMRDQNQEISSEVRVLENLISTIQSQMTELLENERNRRGYGNPAQAANSSLQAEPSVLLESIREALDQNRVDLYIQPIVSLPQRKVRFFEAFTWLRDQEGKHILPSDYLRIAEPSGMISLIDNLLLFRCVQIVRRLSERNRHTPVFCNISVRSLKDAEFFPQFVEYMESYAHLNQLLVFEFGQAAIDACDETDWQNLERLAGLGFYFSMDNISVLDFDMHELRQRNFTYLKVNSAILVDGMASAGARFDASDFKELAFRNGIDLIAEKIEDERAVVEILDYDVDYGQGYLFGTPKPLNESAIADTIVEAEADDTRKETAA